MIKKLLIALAIFLITHVSSMAQNVVAFQGGEGTTADNWNYIPITSAGGPANLLPGPQSSVVRTGNFSIRVGGGNLSMNCTGGTSAFLGCNKPILTGIGSISGTTLNVTSVSGQLFVNYPINGPGIIPGTYITAILSAPTNTTGTYSISISQTVPANSTFNTNSAVGCNMHGNTLEFEPICISGLSDVRIKAYFSSNGSAHVCGGGFDNADALYFEVNEDNNGWVVKEDMFGGADNSWTYNMTSVGGVTNPTPNPFDYFVTPGTSTVAFRIRGVIDRSDEFFYVDDVSITTSSPLPTGAGQWNGSVNSNWHNPCNWDNKLVPSPNTNVVIPSTAANICEVLPGYTAFCGNLDVNKMLKVENPTSKIVINGNLIIQSNGELDMSSTSSLGGNMELSGDWINQRNEQYFYEEGSNVKFFGAANQNIQVTGANGNKEVFSALDINKKVTMIGTISGTTLTVTSVTNGSIFTNLLLTGTGINANTKITAFVSGTGGVGTYTINSSHTISNPITISGSFGRVIPNEDIWIDPINLRGNTTVLKLTYGIFDFKSFTKKLRVGNSMPGAVLRPALGGGVLLEDVSNQTTFTRAINTSPGNYEFPLCVSNNFLTTPIPPLTTYQYIPITISNLSGTVGDVTVSTYSTPANNLPFPTQPVSVNNLNSTTGLTPDNSAATVNRFWNISASSSLTGSIKFSYCNNNPNEVPGSPYGNPLDMRAQYYNDPTERWVPPSNGQSAGNYFVTVPNTPINYTWAISNLVSPLPIELLFFNASPNENNNVDLFWETASETNSWKFFVERSDGLNPFEKILEVNAAGNSTSNLDYTAVDQYPLLGVSYYRLREIDIDGSEQLSEPVKVVIDDKSRSNFSLYPNPTNHEFFLVSHGTNTAYKLLDAMGRVLKTIIPQSGHTTRVDCQDLPNGIYFVLDDAGFAQKLIVQ